MGIRLTRKFFNCLLDDLYARSIRSQNLILVARVWPPDVNRIWQAVKRESVELEKANQNVGFSYVVCVFANRTNIAPANVFQKARLVYKLVELFRPHKFGICVPNVLPWAQLKLKLGQTSVFARLLQIGDQFAILHKGDQHHVKGERIQPIGPVNEVVLVPAFQQNRKALKSLVQRTVWPNQLRV